MDNGPPYLVMRSTHAEPRCYGARLYVGKDHDEADFGTMGPADEAIFNQACGLVKASFGLKAFRRLIPDKDTTDITVANRQCVYALENNMWCDEHADFGPDLSITYRVPGWHPAEDVWESANSESIVRVTDSDDDSVWFVADLVRW